MLTEGDDLLILAIGYSVNEAVTAYRTLKKDHGISATVVNGRFVKPLDIRRIAELVGRIPRVITIEENVRQGGFGGAVVEALADAGISGYEIVRLGIGDRFVEHGDATLLRDLHGVNAPAIVEAAQRLLARRSQAPGSSQGAIRQ